MTVPDQEQLLPPQPDGGDVVEHRHAHLHRRHRARADPGGGQDAGGARGAGHEGGLHVARGARERGGHGGEHGDVKRFWIFYCCFLHISVDLISFLVLYLYIVHIVLYSSFRFDTFKIKITT